MIETGNNKIKKIEDIPDNFLLGYCKQKSTESLYFFTCLAFKMMYPNVPLQQNWHIKYICDLFQQEIERITKREPKTKDIIINISPRSLKSFITNVAAPAWSWIINPYMRWISTSHTMSLSTKHNVDCRRLVESTNYQIMFPEIQMASDSNQKTYFSNIFGGGKIATSVDSGITGEGADIILIDDPLDPRKAKSDKERQNSNDHCTVTLKTRLNDPDIGIFALIMQRLHEEDPTGYMLKKNPFKYFHVCIPAHAKGKVQPEELRKYYKDDLFFPGRFSQLVLDDLSSSMPAIEYDGQYQQNPTAKEGNIIKQKWFRTIDIVSYNNLVESESIDNIVEKAFTGDTAYTDKKNNDATGILGGSYINNNVYLFVGEKVHLTFPDLIRFLKSFLPENRYDYTSSLRIEPKANGLSVIQQLKAETELNVVPTPSPTDSKETRLNSISRIIESGRVVLVEGSWVEEFINDICGFPNRTDKEYVDCLYYIIEYFCFNKGLNLFPFTSLINTTINMQKYNYYDLISGCPLWGKFEYIITGAYFAKTIDDFDVYSTFGVDAENNLYLINLYRGKQESISQSLQRLIGLHLNFRPNVLCVEDDKHSKVYKQVRESGVDFKIKPQKESGYKTNFVDSFDTMSVWFEESKIKLPYSASAKKNTNIIFQEFNSIDKTDPKQKEMIERKGIVKSFWLAFKALYMVNSGIQF